MTRDARIAAIARLVPAEPPLVDVGSDHGRIAAAIGAIATERRPHRAAGERLATGASTWVIADGLKPFRRVGVAVIAGMGWATIARILTEGPTPGAAVVHAPDRPAALRAWLGENGWRLCAEELAPDGNGFAQIALVRPGAEPSAGLEREFGPHLLAGDHPLRAAYLAHERERWQRIADAAAVTAPARCAEACARVAFLEQALARR